MKKVALFEKLKNVFTEEEDIPIKKEVTHVEIPGTEDLKKEEPNKEEIPFEKKEEKFTFPVYFDDDDFSELEPPKKKPEREMYNFKTKEEIKTFRLSPVISPVYGVLEKNYNKEDVKVNRSDIRSAKTRETTLEMVRRKAYGSLEDEIETSIIEVEEIDPIDIVEEKIVKDYKPEILEDNITLAELNKNESETLEDLKIEEEDLFNLIDSMYDKEEEDV